jgi:hypothetical protein
MSNSDIEAAAVRFYDDLLGDDSRNTCDIEVSDLADFAEQQLQAERVRIAGHLEDAIYLADKNPYDADSAVDELRGLLKELKGESQ